jgi:hypothetical protein
MNLISNTEVATYRMESELHGASFKILCNNTQIQNCLPGTQDLCRPANRNALTLLLCNQLGYIKKMKQATQIYSVNDVTSHLFHI